MGNRKRIFRDALETSSTIENKKYNTPVLELEKEVEHKLRLRINKEMIGFIKDNGFNPLVDPELLKRRVNRILHWIDSDRLSNPDKEYALELPEKPLCLNEDGSYNAEVDKQTFPGHEAMKRFKESMKQTRKNAKKSGAPYYTIKKQSAKTAW